MDKKQAYIEKLDAQLKQWAAKIDELKAKADKAKSERKAEYLQTIEKLREKENAVKTRMKELRESSGDAWENLEGGMEKAWSDLKTAVENALKKYQ